MTRSSHGPSSESRFASIFSQAPIPLAVLVGPTLVYEFVNERYIELVSRKDLLGLTVRNAFPGEAYSPFHDAIDKVYQTGIRYEAKEALVRLGRGEPGVLEDKYLDFTYQAIRNEQGEIEAILVVATEVTDRRDAKLAVLRERTRLESLLQQAPVPICMLEGPEHRFTLVNPAYDKLVSQGRNFLGKPVREAVPEVEGQGFFELLDKVYRTGVAFSGTEIPIELSAPDSRRLLYLNFVYQPMFDENKKVYGIMVVAIDVTSQVSSRIATQKSETNFRQIAESMPQIVWTSAPNGILNYTNQRWIAYSGSVEPSEWGLYVHPEDLEGNYLKWMHSVKTGENYETEFRLRKKDGTYRWHLARAIPVKDESGTILKWHGTCTDIEDQKRVQNALVETSNQLLHSERDLQIAKDQAETANQLKTSFLANMSHEIRTPLGAILGFTEILKTGAHDLNERQRYLDVISKNGKALTRIIDDILDLSKVEAGRLEVETISFSVRTLIDEIFALFSDTVKEKGIHLHAVYSAAMPEMLISDPMRLRQILINVIGNAVKFTDQGEIKVNLNADVVGTRARVIIEVVDSGVGLTAQQAERLFQPFHQADNSTTRKFGGTGLGLALSKRLAIALDGDVTLEQYRPGEGCVFCVEIRAEVPAESKAENPAEPVVQKNDLRSLSGVRVLVVDDSVDNLELLEIILQDEGVKVETAKNGEEAIEKAMADPFDIILMDIQMPGIDGHEAVKILRKRGYLLPIIALTAHAMKEERDRTAASGFNDHVSKPIHFETLLKSILKLTTNVPSSSSSEMPIGKS